MLPDSRQITFVFFVGAMCVKYKRNVFPMKTTELAYGKWKSFGVQGFMLGALSMNFTGTEILDLKA